ncbi:MAG: type II secretion system protein GspE, partial [Desulfuromusa sp.]|nr:type II secretion system protein GspE [Desulfuromusa sp.]
MSVSRLGELLVRNQMISDSQLANAISEQKKEGTRLGAALVKLGYVQEHDLASFLSKHYGVPSIDLAEFDIDPAVVALVPAEVAQKYQLIPVNRAGATLIVAMADPSNIFAIDDIKFMTGFNVEVVVAAEAAIKAAIDKFYDQSSTMADALEGLEDLDDLELLDESSFDDVGEL